MIKGFIEVQPLKSKAKPKNTITLLACCIALTLSAESASEVELKPDQQDIAEVEALAVKNKPIANTDTTFEVFLSAGYRKDKLNWNEASANGSVNIMSELKWENLDIAQINVAAKLNINIDWSIRGKLNYGRVSSGSNQDSDYNGNNRTLEYSRSNNKGSGEVSDASIGMGRTIRLFNNAGENFMIVMPLIGLSIHQQHLTMTDGYQTLPATGPFYGLNNSYDAQWQGPWVGIDTLLKTGENWSLNATAEYHWADYKARANWNLRPLNFTHTAQGQGLLLAAGASYLLSKDTSVNFSVDSQQWHTGAGIDRTLDYSNGSVTWYPLNAVNWESTAFNVGISHIF